MLFEHVLDAFVVAYQGRDTCLAARLQWWSTHLRGQHLEAITADQVDTALMALAQRGAMLKIKGRGTVASGKPLSGATINRYRAALGTLLKWAKARRLLPRAWRSPLADIPQELESTGRTVFIQADDVARVIMTCRVSSDQSQLDCLVSVDKSFFKPAMNSAGVR